MHFQRMNIELVDNSLQEFYSTVKNHITDSGYDLFFPEDITIPAKALGFAIDLKVRCEPIFFGGYYLYPRSSISKTPLRLANSVGIIDNGYRGTLQVRVDNHSTDDFTVKRGERLFQICHPSLAPFEVKIMDKINLHTSRGAGGFGSTN